MHSLLSHPSLMDCRRLFLRDYEVFINIGVHAFEKTREQPICHAGIGHRSVSVCHLGVIATRFFSGQALTWNPRDERFTGERAEAANRHLSRTRRGAWQLEA